MSRFSRARALRCALALLVAAFLSVTPHVARAAEAGTGIVVGRVIDQRNGKPVANAAVDAASGSGRYTVRTDANGNFTLLGITPDTYVIAAQATGFEAERQPGIVVLPGGRASVTFALRPALRVIGTISVSGARSGTSSTDTQDVFRVVGDAARGPATASSSGLGSYARGTVQGAVGSVPGVQQDQFANVILQGGKVEDTVFSFDSVPVPQALIAEPGGNVLGAQLPTTGLGYTNVTTGGLSNSSNQGLSGVIDEIPATGVYPAQGSLTLEEGVVPGARQVELQERFATPDLRHRYALDVETSSEQIAYGDGHTFYPAEAATYGLSLANRATWSVAANAHVKVGVRDDVSFSTLAGQAVYDQYGTPFAGQTYGAFDAPNATYPFETGGPNAAVATPSRIRGTYAVQKLQDLRTSAHATLRVDLYGSEIGASTRAPFFDDLSFPNGIVSYAGGQNSTLYGFGFDVQDVASTHHEISYGSEVRSQRSALDQVVPLLAEHVTSNPLLNSYLTYVSDRWTPTNRISLTGTLRANGTHFLTSDGHRYGVSAIDPHLGLNVRIAPSLAVLATYDRTTVAPLPLQAQRNDTTNPAPFVSLAPERGDSYELAISHDGPVRARLTYFAKAESNLIDVLPANFRTAISAGEQPATQVGVPTNAGNLLVHGFEATLDGGGFTFAGTYTHGFSSSASQFGYNDLNAPALAAGHEFPIGYVPTFSGTLAYRARLGRAVTLVPTLSYESGYPYGNGKSVYVFDPATNEPVLVPNDNNVNPGYNYYYLRDPSRAFDATTNPYVATLGTPEGNDPNTLRSTPQLLASLRAEVTLAKRTTLTIDVSNLFGTSTPTQIQGNPYAIGPPGYTGGNPLYAAYYGKQFAGTPYTLGNGVPTNDGVTQAVPWRYGTAGYIPSSYPNARAVYVRLQQKF